MRVSKDNVSEVYESIAQKHPNLQWADSRCDREVTNSSEDDEQAEDNEQTEEDGYTGVYKGYIEGSEKDGDYITRDIGTGSRSGGGDSYEDTYAGFTDAQLGMHAGEQTSPSTSCTTYFKMKDVPEYKENKFERLRKRNIGVRENWWRQYNEWKETLKDAAYFASRNGLTEYQTEEVVLYTKQLDFQGGRRKEHLLLALVSIVADKYTENWDR